jgi:DNA-binding transcriptional MerR regulator
MNKNTGKSRQDGPALSGPEFLDAHQQAGGAERVWGIAELAAEFGVSARTLRFYEAEGLLAPRRVGRSRIYTRRDRARLALVLRAKSLGSSLDEVRRYLDLYGQRGEGRRQQLEFVVERTAAAIAELTRKQARLEETLAELRLIHASCLRQLRK